jgi:dihydroorotate dehydrogenase electron transfer subunit
MSRFKAADSESESAAAMRTRHPGLGSVSDSVPDRWPDPVPDSRPDSRSGAPRIPHGLPRACRVLSVRDENYRTRTIQVDLELDAAPGQFCMLWLPGLDEKPFSLRAAAPASFTIAAVGPFSRAIHRLEPGDRIWLRGPFGRPFHLEGHDHLLVGGGYGVAPMLYLAEQALARGDRVRAVVGAREARDLLGLSDFAALGAELLYTTEDGSPADARLALPAGAGIRGRVTDAILPMLAGDKPDMLYACGPHGMLDALAALAEPAGLPAQLSWEAYMRCGIGICGSCEHEGLLLCADGPVLDRRSKRPTASQSRALG